MENPVPMAPAIVATPTRGRTAWQRILTVELMLFFGLWLVYGIFINQKNIGMYGQSVTEAIGDYQRFAVDDLPAWPWQMVGDVFVLDGLTYSNKNPGQAIISSIVYAHLKLLGINYTRDKYLAGALVIFFSTSLFTALGAVALFRLARDLAGRPTTIWPLAAALVWSLCTTQMAWAGVAWHDPLAAPMILIAFYFIQRLRSASFPYETARTYSFAAGLLLGFTVTTSMTFLFMTVVFGVYFLSLRRWNLLLPFLVGGVAGIGPLVLYNSYNFGSPFSFPATLYFELTGTPPDVYFFLDWNNFRNQTLAYYGLVTWYAPVIWGGLVGLLFLPRKFRREQAAVLAAIAVLVFYMFNVTGLGVCGYGPRYLLPIMPFCALGIVGFARFPTKTLRLFIGLGVFWVAFESFRVNVVGAIGGSLHCPIMSFAYPAYIENLTRGPMPDFPLFKFLLPLVVVWCITAIYARAPSISPSMDESMPV